MKFICIGRNYAAHAAELHNAVPTKPVFFLKPESAITRCNRPFFLPDFSDEVHYETEIIVKINRLGKCISEKFAHKYYDEIGHLYYGQYKDMNIDVTKDINARCESISNIYKEIEELNIKILREKGLKKCAICSTENQLANAFCFKCGARFADDDAVPADVIAPPNACATPPSEMPVAAPAPAVEAEEAAPAPIAPEEAGE